MIRSLLAVPVAVCVLLPLPADAQDKPAPTPQQGAAKDATPTPERPPPADVVTPELAQPAPPPRQQIRPEPATPEQAQPNQQPTVPVMQGRFAFEKSGETLLRFDRETGQVAVCGPRSVGWGCQAVPEERAALEKEIDRIQEQYEMLDRDYVAARQKNEALEKQLAGLRDQIATLEQRQAELEHKNASLAKEVTELRPPPPRPPVNIPPSVRRPGAGPPPAKDETGSIERSLDRDIARAKIWVKQAWRRLKDMISDFRKDMIQKDAMRKG